ncbi:MAG: hypothetical protein QG656_1686, partial [Candidatus Hydrogenedentes bacterium]|nr:hypothetical protein [Candidatus Hydrogenedentota bacterium]
EKPRSNPQRLFDFFASYGLSVVLLLFLALLTLLGTLEQVDHGLYEVQKQYFESLFLVHWFWDAVPVPLPGVYLLLVLATVNLICGAVIRARKGWRSIGILIAHTGILILMLAAFISFKASVRGHATLYEGERTSEFQSYEEWEIAIEPVAPNTATKSYFISEAEFAALEAGKKTVFSADGLPFELTLDGYAANSQPQQAGMGGADRRVVDGVSLLALASEREAEQNAPGVYASVSGPGAAAETVLWGLSQAPWVVQAEGGPWSIALRHRSWPLPFTVQLDKFTRELYPGTQMPKAFKSDVTRIDGDDRQQAVISMNQPLRHKGYTLYQASYGPSNAPPGTPMYSSLAVVRNPADQFPLYSCVIICFGLFIHFGQTLVGYLRAESRKRS